MSNKLNRSCFIIEVIEVDSDDVDDDDYDDDVDGGVYWVYLVNNPTKNNPEEKDDIQWSWEGDSDMVDTPPYSPSRPMCPQSPTPSPTNFSPSIHSLSLPLSSSPNKETTTHMWTDFGNSNNNNK